MSTLPGLTPLSTDQITTLKILFRQAWDAMVKCGAIDEPGRGKVTAAFAEWCHAEQLDCCGRESMRLCDQSHWRDLCARALLLNGNTEQAFAMLLKATPKHADRELQLFLLEQAIAATAKAVKGALTMGYAVAIARNRFKVHTLDDCTAEQLQQLVWTVINRGNAKRNVGNTFHRNKKQGRKGTKATGTEAPRERQAEAMPVESTKRISQPF